MKAFAINTVHICREPGELSPEGKITKQAVIEAMTPGSVFELDKEQFAEIEKTGAIRVAKKADIAAFEERTGQSQRLV